MTTILFIGDPHFKVDNIPEVELLIDRIEKIAIEKNPDIICIAGDLLDTHERLHTIPLNKAYNFIDRVRKISKTYVLVGNHDMCNNQQFLTENHWMNGLKEWNNVVIVDKVINIKIKGEELIFCPYVYPGRFQEALNMLNMDWKECSIIFAHQEFKGCKMGAIISIDGDNWPETYPEVVSGHIHSRQIPQKNIYYSGSSMQHAFGESEKNVIAYLTVKNKTYEKEEIDLSLPRKKIIYLEPEDLETYILKQSDDKIKLSVSGNFEEFKAIKKTEKYKELIEKGIKIVFKHKKVETKDNNEMEKMATEIGFRKILNELILIDKNNYLTSAYEKIINNNDIDENDIMIL